MNPSVSGITDYLEIAPNFVQAGCYFLFLSWHGTGSQGQVF
jgi:hypothetical protein